MDVHQADVESKRDVGSTVEFVSPMGADLDHISCQDPPKFVNQDEKYLSDVKAMEETLYKLENASKYDQYLLLFMMFTGLQESPETNRFFFDEYLPDKGQVNREFVIIPDGDSYEFLLVKNHPERIFTPRHFEISEKLAKSLCKYVIKTHEQLKHVNLDDWGVKRSSL